jgi:DNA-binding transcriptional ArsR family regulator
MRRNRELDKLRDNAGEAADFLSLLANDRRLLILCELLAAHEMSVGNLADAVDLSQSALSQHLSKLRAEGLVETRRESQTIFYKLSADERVTQTLSFLKNLFCR